MRVKTFKPTFGLLLIVIAALGFSGCGNDDVEYLFEVDHAFNIQLPAGAGTINSIVLPFTNLTSLIAIELGRRNLTVDDIKAVHTVRARVDLVSFDGNLSDYIEAEVNVYSGSNPRNNAFEAGYTIQIKDQNLDRIDIIPSLSNLKEVLGRNIFNMELVMRPRRISPRNMAAVFSISFGVVL